MAKKNEKKVEEVEKKQNARRPCCDKDKVRRGAWTPQEDKILIDFIRENGHVIWQELPELAGLNRCGKSCRLRWTNYLRPDIKRGSFTLEEEYTISRLHAAIGSKWSIIAANLPGRTDNDIKNYWNSHLRRRFDNIQFNQPSFSSMSMGVNSESAAITRHRAEWELVRLEAEARLPKKVLPDQPSVANSEGDVFLRLWNSEVGISFQNINASMGDECSGKRTYRPTSQISLTKVGNPEVGNSFHSINTRIGECSGTKTGSPASLTSLMTQVDSGLGSGFTTSAEPCKNLGSTDMACPKYMGNPSNYKEADIMAAYSNATKSYDLDDCEAMWNILLDFSNTGNDLELL